MVAPVSTDFFWMQAEHGTTIVGILTADVKDGVTRSDIDGRQENLRTASLTGSLDDGIAVCRKFLAIEMTMGIFIIEN